MEAKKELVPSILNCDKTLQEFMLCCYALRKLNESRALMQTQRKKLEPNVNRFLEQQQKKKFLFDIPPELEHDFGNVFAGVGSKLRTRDEVFNSKTFPPALVRAAIPVFRTKFPTATSIPDDTIIDFAIDLAKETWASRGKTSTYEVYPVLKPLTQINAKNDASKKRKQANDPGFGQKTLRQEDIAEREAFLYPRIKKEFHQQDEDDDDVEDIDNHF